MLFIFRLFQYLSLFISLFPMSFWNSPAISPSKISYGVIILSAVLCVTIAFKTQHSSFQIPEKSTRDSVERAAVSAAKEVNWGIEDNVPRRMYTLKNFGSSPLKTWSSANLELHSSSRLSELFGYTYMSDKGELDLRTDFPTCLAKRDLLLRFSSLYGSCNSYLAIVKLNCKCRTKTKCRLRSRYSFPFTPCFYE